MKRMIGGMAALAAGLLLSASAAQAQVVGTTRPVTFGLAGGISLPQGDLSVDVKSGFIVQGSLGLRMPLMPIGLRADAMFNQFKFDAAAGAASGNFRIIGGTLDAILTMPGAMMVKPYLIGGVGIYNLKANFDNASVSGESTTKFGLNGGAGLEFGLSGFKTFVEARYNSAFTEGGKTNFIPIVFGIMF